MERLSLLAQLSNLRKVVHDMEVDLGLASLERKERDILLAFYATGKTDPVHGLVARTEVVRQHPTLSDISQPTFHRALRRLVERGLIKRPADLPPGTYLLQMD
jgi:DNA-binding MarR family transcriptional regulator